MLKHRPRLATFIAGGAAIDLAVFCVSFLFFGGPHGPAGPMFVVGVLNFPVRYLVKEMNVPHVSSTAVLLLVMFGVVLINGALYGLVAWSVVRLCRRFCRARAGVQ